MKSSSPNAFDMFLAEIWDLWRGFKFHSQENEYEKIEPIRMKLQSVILTVSNLNYLVNGIDSFNLNGILLNTFCFFNTVPADPIVIWDWTKSWRVQKFRFQ